MAAPGDSANGPNKRRRMSTGDDHGDDASMDEKTVTTSKCKGATTIPIFLKSELQFACAKATVEIVLSLENCV